MLMRATADRVWANTSYKANRHIAEETERSIRYYAAHPEQISARLEQLDREWDIERALQANAAAITILSMALGLFKRRGFFLVPGVVGGFLLQHAIKGWCPPLPVFRRLGFRTAAEIEAERYALKALRGDFNDLEDIPRGHRADRVLEATDTAVDGPY